MSRSPKVAACWLGRVSYQDAWDLQRELVEKVRAGDEEEALLLLEHPHVFTMGRKATLDHVLWDEDLRRRREVDLIWSDRGGDATYHGPGQLVGYPIINVEDRGKDLLTYLRTLERSLVEFLAELGVESGVVPGLTGVWAGGDKVAAIGVKMTGGVASHGFALNLTTDLGYFEGIVPCGLADKQATSVERLTGRRIEVQAAAIQYADYFARDFNIELSWSTALSGVISA